MAKYSTKLIGNVWFVVEVVGTSSRGWRAADREDAETQVAALNV